MASVPGNFKMFAVGVDPDPVHLTLDPVESQVVVQHPRPSALKQLCNADWGHGAVTGAVGRNAVRARA